MRWCSLEAKEFIESDRSQQQSLMVDDVDNATDAAEEMLNTMHLISQTTTTMTTTTTVSIANSTISTTATSSVSAPSQHTPLQAKPKTITDRRFQFRQEFVQEVVYEMVSFGHRRQWHRAIAEW
jgi:hypothetical protein